VVCLSPRQKAHENFFFLPHPPGLPIFPAVFFFFESLRLRGEKNLQRIQKLFLGLSKFYFHST